MSSSANHCSNETSPRFDAADFDYVLPPERIAQHPLTERSASRLLVLDRQSDTLQDRMVKELPDFLNSGDVLVFNDTRVIAARLHGQKSTGGKLEILVERILPSNRVLAQMRTNRPPALGSEIHLAGDVAAEVEERQGRFWVLRFPAEIDLNQFLEGHGQVPLPPYIERHPDASDQERYQTIYAQTPGAVAAPTAGLHFDASLMSRLEDLGVECLYVTLHVGAGTFQPIEAEDIRDHQMHAERLNISEEICEKVNRAQKQGRRIIAVGTTSARALESAVTQEGRLAPYVGETQLYLYPGRKFAILDGLLTNFHLPKSSLLVMVSAFAGREKVLQAYQHAIEQKYRFYSYGDAMLIV